MPPKKNFSSKGAEVAKLKQQLAVLKNNMRVEPHSVKVRPDPPPIVQNPSRLQTIELKVTGATSAPTGQQIVDAIAASNGLASGFNMRVKVFFVALYGPAGVAKSKITLTDALTGFSVSDQPTTGGRSAVKIVYPHVALPTIDTATGSLSGILVNCVVEEAAQDNYGLIRVNVKWRTY